ncbi:Alpha/Beta hydrolase protein [Ephemerocybe angulata]|uniref:Alpha/Beta hydrolase protein n=1 Tax=Ephemerocybe angulata TaxID=980116 RepID=A0A8H6H8U6_9AGAR|nr:Alpha/Beta hydrolase protein [Tulosesus angulatus]
MKAILEPEKPRQAGSKDVFTVARRVAVGLIIAYVGVILFIMLPAIQTYTIYAHHIDVWGFKKFEHPEHYGLAPGKTVNMKLTSSDNTAIGAWFIFSDPFYRTLPHPHLHTHVPGATTSHDSIQATSSKHIPEAVGTTPTILFLHGNTGTRAHQLRTILYSSLTARLGANILAIDYRGFGDSSGHPTVQGVGRDARAGFDYLVQQGAKPQDILIIGHSLGTAVAGLLASELGRENVHFRGVVLMSPFSSIRTLLDQYYLLGCLPLFKPLAKVPLMPRVLSWSLKHGFDTLSLVPDIKSDVLIAHAEDDWDIPHTHSSALFNAFLDPSEPFAAPNTSVSTTHISGYGSFSQARVANRNVALLKTERGGHDLGKVEGVQDTIGRLFGLYSAQR